MEFADWYKVSRGPSPSQRETSRLTMETGGISEITALSYLEQQELKGQKEIQPGRTCPCSATT